MTAHVRDTNITSFRRAGLHGSHEAPSVCPRDAETTSRAVPCSCVESEEGKTRRTHRHNTGQPSFARMAAAAPTPAELRVAALHARLPPNPACIPKARRLPFPTSRCMRKSARAAPRRARGLLSPRPLYRPSSFCSLSRPAPPFGRHSISRVPQSILAPRLRRSRSSAPPATPISSFH